MQYLCLIYSAPASENAMDPATRRQYMMDYGTFTEELQESGRHVGSNALQGIDMATTVRVREGKILTTDGPFAETKEHLGGYYLVEAQSLDEAIEIAAKIPTAKVGSIEVRPILDWSAPNAEAESQG